MAMRLRSWRRLRKGQLRGFACVDLDCGLQIADVAVIANAEGHWARLPQCPKVRDGYHLRAESGTGLYNAPFTWQTRQLANEFSVAVVSLVRQAWPDDLD